MKRSTLIAALATATALAASTLTAEAGMFDRSSAGMSGHRGNVETINYRHNRHGYFHRPYFRPFWPSWRHRHHHWR